MGNGNMDVGSSGAARKLRRPTIESLAGPDGFPQLRIDGRGPVKDRPRLCGAMSQQHGESGRSNESAPQELIHLVGFRDPNARAEGAARPRPKS